MPTIKFVNEKKTIEVEPGTNLRRAARQEGVNVYNDIGNVVNCMGLGSCGTCRVFITKGIENTNPPGLKERLRVLLGPLLFFWRIGHEKELRLSCQTRVYGDIEVVTHPESNWHGEKFWG